MFDPRLGKMRRGTVGRIRTGFLIVLGMASTLLVTAGQVFAQTENRPPNADLSSIQHFVFIIKENRTFDNYFGTFPGAEGATSGQISTGEISLWRYRLSGWTRLVCSFAYTFE